MLSKIKEFFLSENGATMIEYALVCAGIGLIIAALFSNGGSIQTALTDKLVTIYNSIPSL